MSGCVNKSFYQKAMKELGISEEALVSAVKTLEDNNVTPTLEALKQYFLISDNCTFPIKDKKIVESLSESLDKYSKKHQAIKSNKLSKVRENAEELKKSIGIPYVIYQNVDGTYACNFAKPVYSAEAKTEEQIRGIKKYKTEKELKEEESNQITEQLESGSLDEIQNFVNDKLINNPRIKREGKYRFTLDKVNSRGVTTLYNVLHPAKDPAMLDKWGVATKFGDVADDAARDFFMGKWGVYNNLSKKQAANLKKDLEKLQKHFDFKFGTKDKDGNVIPGKRGVDYEIVTQEFPIGGYYTYKDANGDMRTEALVGILDMLIYDKYGNFYIYDFKCKRNGFSKEDLIKYSNQLQMYKAFLEAQYPELKGRIKTPQLILFDTKYPAPNGTIRGSHATYTYSQNKGSQVYLDGIPIQEYEFENSKYEDTPYQAPRLHIIDNNTGTAFTEVLSGKEALEGTVLSDMNELDLFKEEFGDPKEIETHKPEPMSKVNKNAANNTNSLYANPLLSAEERTFLSKYIMNMTSFIVTQLQTVEEAAETYFGDSFKGIDFKRLTREDIIRTVGINTIFNYIRELYFDADTMDFSRFGEDITDDQLDTILNKLALANDNWNELCRIGYSKLITLEGVTVIETTKDDKIKTDMFDESVNTTMDSGTLEEKEREYWQMGIRHISAKNGLSAEIRRAFEKLFAVDENGDYIKDSYGFGLNTFVNSDTAINQILSWVNSATDINEMERILKDMAPANPWVNSIIELIQNEPFRSKFYQDFRKDFTTYSTVFMEYDNGKRIFTTHIINTKNASSTILDNLSFSFKTGAMKNLIIPVKGDIEGRGKVNSQKVNDLYNRLSKINTELNSVRVKSSDDQFKQILLDNTVELATIFSDLGIPILPKTLRVALIKTNSNGEEIPNKFIARNLIKKSMLLLNTLKSQSKRTDYNPMLREETNNIYSDYASILEYLDKYMQDAVEASTYENGKMHYSFNTPSYMGKLITNLSDSINDPSKFKNFIEQEYASYKWFKTREDKDDKGTWNNVWLDLIENNADIRSGLQHKVQLSFNKIPYVDLSELGYTLSLMHEFFFDKNEKWAWYRIPILGNKPSSEFVKFKRWNTRNSNWKETMTSNFRKVFDQEFMRIRTVLERALDPTIQPIGAKGKAMFDIDPKILNEEIKVGKRTLTRREYLKEKFYKKEISLDDLVVNGKFIFGNSGAQFKFLPAFNQNLKSKDALGRLIMDKVNDKKTDEAALSQMFADSFNEYMDELFEKEKETWKELGLYETETRRIKKKSSKNNKAEYEDVVTYKHLHQFGDSIEEIDKKLENYVWNDMFATINIIELTATDLAYYGTVENFQKRYSQIHAPSMKLNKYAKMQDGTLYSKDGVERTMYLADDFASSEIAPNVSVIFDKAISKLNSKEEKAQMKQMRDLIVSEFKRINVADAQGFSSPTSFRKKLAMAGSWDDDMETAYEEIRKGNLNINNLGVVWQPRKPFVYSQIRKNSGVSTMAELKVGVQNKNSEYLLLIADAILTGGDKANKLSAIYDFMEETAYDGREQNNGKIIKQGTYNGIGIDTVQFVSAVNAGSMGAIDISNTFIESIRKEFKENGLEDAMEALAMELSNPQLGTVYNEKEIEIFDALYNKISDKTSEKEFMELLKEAEYKEIKAKLHGRAYKNSNKTIERNAEGELEADPYDDQFVHNIPFEDYGFQQEVPRHLQDHNQLVGSQMRILSVSDISNEYDNLDDEELEEKGFKVYAGTRNGVPQYKYYDKSSLTARYMNRNAVNIRESFDKLAKEFKIHSKNKKERNEAISEILVDAVLKDQRYGNDLLRACTINKETKEFNIPLNDPIQSVRVQQLINSIIKSRVNKQTMPGGPVVQATSFGMSKDLSIRFKDKKGKILPTFNEYGKSEAEYKKFLDKNQASLAYFECYMPIPTADLERMLLKPDGSFMSIKEAIDTHIIPEEMTKAIGYRIPTEDKYSMAPLKIMGFLPKAAGEAIMLPKEITLLSGSDFDIDKMYIMLKNFKKHDKIDTSNLRSGLKEHLAKNFSESDSKARTKAINFVIDAIKKDSNNPEQWLNTDTNNLENAALAYYKVNVKQFTTVVYSEYFEKGDTSSKTLRDNEIFDMQWAVLTHEDTMEKMFNPGSFDVQKATARKINLLKKGHNWNEIENKSLKELDALTEEDSDLNICLSSTQVYFHKQNMTAGKLIGIFANNNTSHAFLSFQDIKLKFKNKEGFTFNGITVDNNGNNKLDNLRDFNGKLISKNIAGFLAASVDAVKDPVLNFMNLNTVTAGPAMLLARLGFDVDSIGLLLSQPSLEKLSREYLKRSNDGSVSVKEVIQTLLSELNNDYNVDVKTLAKNLKETAFSQEELAEGIRDGFNSPEFQARVLLLFQTLSDKANHLQTLTFLTKFNSVTNAVGPTIADTLVMRERYKKFLDIMQSKNAPFEDEAIDVINNNDILKAFYESTVDENGASEGIFKHYFPHYSTAFTQVLDRYRDSTKAPLSSKVINKLVNDYLYFKFTSGQNPLIDANSEERNRFINRFAKDFRKRAEGILNNALIDAISIDLASAKCPTDTLVVKTGGYSADRQEQVRNAWTELIVNPETQELAADLFIYNLYRNGFNFSPKTFLHLASVDVKLAITNYIESIGNNDFSEIEFLEGEFLCQFRRNHSTDKSIVPELKTEFGGVSVNKTKQGSKDKLEVSFKEAKDIFSITTEEVTYYTKLTELRGKFAPVITYNEDVYILDNDNAESGIVTYIKSSPLGNSNNFLEYNANEKALDMESVIGKTIQEDPEDNDPNPNKDENEGAKEETNDEITEEEVNEAIEEIYGSTTYKKSTFGIKDKTVKKQIAANLVIDSLGLENDDETQADIMDMIQEFLDNNNMCE